MRSITKLYQINNTLFGNRVFSLFSGTSCIYKDLKFTKSHEWVETLAPQKRVRVGITNFAQSQLGEIVHVQLPTVGKSLNSGDSAMTIESVKMAADIYTPVTGKVVQVNEQVTGNPGTVNEAADKTWLFEMEYNSEPSGLLNLQEYEKLTKQSH